ncbi:MAG: histidine kinase dimerization/phospho-acceptor domain-containing protein [Bacilli bacterium]|nr:histidine kinase dimerization/phospho-acceptor domain-containing protein [Bacilli bacterium]
MNLKLFGSMGFAICALGYLILILLMYINKKKTGDIQSKVFAALLGLAIALTFCEMGYVYGLSVIDTNPKLTELTCRIYTIGDLIWINLLIYYLVTLFEKYDDKEKERRHNLITFLVLLVLVVIIVAVSTSLPFDYSSSKSGFYNYAGPGANIAYIDGVVLLITICIVMIFKWKSIAKNQKGPIYFSIFLFILIIIPQLLLDYDYNTVTFMFALMVATLYFTIESQDSKLIQELKYSKEEATIADKAKTEFLINMSHEIRTPMSTILGFSEVLLNEKPLTEEIAKRDTENIYKASSVLTELIDAILDISALETNKEKIENGKYNINNLMSNVEAETIAKTNENIEYKTSINKNIPPEFIGDSKKMHKIFNNIINYLLKSTPDGIITTAVDYRKMEKDNYQLIFNISSNNCYIPEEKFDIEFNDFVKLGENKDNSINNDDLKLIIAKRYINLLNGRVAFKNTNNHCECIIYFVQSIGKDSTPLVEETYEKSVTTKKVLIVDSNKVNHIIISKLLEEYHYNISSAYTEEEYANKVSFEKFDLILIDSSYIDETLEQSLKGINMNTVIIEMNENRVEKSKNYINDIIYKPVSKDDINKIIYKYINEEKDVRI